MYEAGFERAPADTASAASPGATIGLIGESIDPDTSDKSRFTDCMSMPPSAKGLESALAAMEPDTPPLEAIRVLRRAFFSPDVARLGALLLELRQRARGRMPRAEILVLTRTGLEQATSMRVAALRAARIAEALPDALVVDATVGVGGDALALSEQGLRVVAMDASAEHARCAAENLRRSGFGARVVVADAASPPLRSEDAVLVLDPDRRADGTRSLDPERWSPPWSTCSKLVQRFRAGCVKLAPAFDVDIASVPCGLSHSWQWTSLDGSLVEVTLWTGDLARDPTRREVFALRGDVSQIRYSAAPREVAALDPAAAAAVEWVFDPDPALVRSGLLGAYAAEQGLAPLGPRIAFLGGGARPDAALLRGYRVLGQAPADRRRVRAMLRAHDVGPVTVKKRGHPRSAAELERALRGPGSRRGVLLVTRLARGHRAFLVEGPRME